MSEFFVKVIWNPTPRTKKIAVILEPTGSFTSYEEAYNYGLKKSRDCIGKVYINVWEKKKEKEKYRDGTKDAKKNYEQV